MVSASQPLPQHLELFSHNRCCKIINAAIKGSAGCSRLSFGSGCLRRADSLPAHHQPPQPGASVQPCPPPGVSGLLPGAHSAPWGETFNLWDDLCSQEQTRAPGLGPQGNMVSTTHAPLPPAGWRGPVRAHSPPDARAPANAGGGAALFKFLPSHKTNVAWIQTNTTCCLKTKSQK